ncbi:MAG TPA: hypothetical protein VKX46_10085 [Ktedonobacteraceae bacterium]|nr:hypothetical protein [Ktedonobacteraceae bacterium]
MDSSLQRAGLHLDELDMSIDTGHEEAEGAEHHVHLPGPSLWPVLLSVAILVTVAGLLFIPDNPWLSIVAAPFIVVGIMGWALEDPFPASAEQSPVVAEGAQPSFQLGEDVLDKDGEWIGMVQARFSRYILVDRGGLTVRVYYVPLSLIAQDTEKHALRLTVGEEDLYRRGLDSVPDDLYDEQPDPGLPRLTGVPLFARGPLSPAQTGHYNYGPNFPGINTDAAGSYYPEEVRPSPQKYVGERRKSPASGRARVRQTTSTR